MLLNVCEGGTLSRIRNCNRGGLVARAQFHGKEGQKRWDFGLVLRDRAPSASLFEVPKGFREEKN